MMMANPEFQQVSNDLSTVGQEGPMQMYVVTGERYKSTPQEATIMRGTQGTTGGTVTLTVKSSVMS